MPLTPVLAADPVFGTPTIDATFGEGVELTQPVTLDETPARVEVLLTFADASPLVVELPPPTTIGSTTLRHEVSVAADGHILPNTPVSAQWRITPEDGDPVVGPEVDAVYADERFDWQTVAGDLVTVHWYEGGAAFGQRALRIGEDAVRGDVGAARRHRGRTDRLLHLRRAGSVLRRPRPGYPRERRRPGERRDPHAVRARRVESTSAGSRSSCRMSSSTSSSTRPSTTRTTSRRAGSTRAWPSTRARATTPATARPSNRRPAPARSSRSTGSIGQFPTGDGFFLAYAESVSAVDFFIRTHDQDALVALIGSYADGLTDDEAFQAAIGMDTAAFNEAWLADLGAVVPERHGPAAGTAGSQAVGVGRARRDSRCDDQCPATRHPSPARTRAAGDDDGAPLGGNSTLVLVIVAVAVFGAAGLLVWSRTRRGRPGAVP